MPPESSTAGPLFYPLQQALPVLRLYQVTIGEKAINQPLLYFCLQHTLFLYRRVDDRRIWLIKSKLRKQCFTYISQRVKQRLNIRLEVRPRVLHGVTLFITQLEIRALPTIPIPVLIEHSWSVGTREVLIGHGPERRDIHDNHRNDEID